MTKTEFKKYLLEDIELNDNEIIIGSRFINKEKGLFAISEKNEYGTTKYRLYAINDSDCWEIDNTTNIHMLFKWQIDFH